MKKYVFIMAILFGLAIYYIGKSYVKLYDKGYDIVVIDGCDYIQTSSRFGAVMQHKANCENPIHQK